MDALAKIHNQFPAKSSKQLNQADDRQYIPEPYKKFAEDQETQFVEFMLDQMEKTVGAEEADSTASEYYKSLLLNERAKSMANKDGGLGIQELILNQVYPNKFRNKFAYEQYLRHQAMQMPKQPEINQNSINKIEISREGSHE